MPYNYNYLIFPIKYDILIRLHILIGDSKGILLVKMYSLSFDVVKMCSNIERYVFRASLNGAHFFVWSKMYGKIYDIKWRAVY